MFSEKKPATLYGIKIMNMPISLHLHIDVCVFYLYHQKSFIVLHTWLLGFWKTSYLYQLISCIISLAIYNSKYPYKSVMHQIYDWAKYRNRHSSKNIWVIKLSFCQNDPPIGESFWQNTSLVTHITYELCLFWYLAQSKWLLDSTC